MKRSSCLVILHLAKVEDSVLQISLVPSVSAVQDMMDCFASILMVSHVQMEAFSVRMEGLVLLHSVER